MRGRSARRRDRGRPGRLPDADRQPRGRHAARARRAARGRPRRVRGHAPHARPARALRGAGDAGLLPRAQRARADARARRPHARRRGRRARLRRRHAAGRDPGYVLVAGCIAAGLEVEVLPGPSAALAALVASGLPAERWRFAGFLRASAGRSRRCSVRRRRSWPSSPRAGRRVAAGARRARPGAPGGGLPRADEAPRGDRAREAAELAARYADQPPRGEVVLVVGAAPPRGEPTRGRRRRPPARRGGSPARPPASVVAELTGGAANDLYRAVTEGAQDRDD